MTGQHVHTDGNAVPPVDDTKLNNLLDDLDDIHPGIDLIRDGIRLLASSRHDLDTTQLLTVTLAGSPDGTDVLGLIAHLGARLTNPDTNPALRTLGFEAQKHCQRAGELLAHHLTDPDLHQHAANASAAIHTD
ncbi:hypothetical protein [Streptomyces glaucescens]|uniref:hypothetical protein n=1 Tax=Streptomyces glaucescens TaxID=1907 RepID=UPI000A37CC5C|nr:hypothetical protein [Streptomyces glaucescens]